MLGNLRYWIDYRRQLRRRWQADAKRLLAAEETNAYYEAQRRATHARIHRDRSEFYNWAKVAAEIARFSPQVDMNLTVLKLIVDGEERRAVKRRGDPTTNSRTVVDRYCDRTGGGNRVPPGWSTLGNSDPRSLWMAFLVRLRIVPINPQGVRSRAAAAWLRRRGDRDLNRTLTDAIERGSASLNGGALQMSHDLSLAQNHAFNLSRTLMVSVTLFEVNGEFGVMPSDELDDADVEVIHEYDPYQVGSAH